MLVLVVGTVVTVIFGSDGVGVDVVAPGTYSYYYCKCCSSNDSVYYCF